MIKSWIVYIDDKGKTDAIVDNHEDAHKWVESQKYKIIGYPAFNRKQDAIDYCEQMFR